MTDFKTKYGAAWVDLTITLASLPTDANKLTGRASTAIVNTSDLFLDVLIGGKITTGTSPTDAKTIEVWAYGENLDASTYNDGITGSDAAKTMTSANIKNAALRHLATLNTNNTSNRTFPFGPTGLARLFGGIIPARWGIFVTHDTGVNLNATAGNHQISYLGVHTQSV